VTVTAGSAPHSIATMRIATCAGGPDGTEMPARPVALLLTRRRTIDYCRVAAAPCCLPGRRLSA
jgi:hypothetical protein